MKLRSRQPALFVSPFVREIWEMEGHGEEEHSFAFFADGNPGLFFLSSSSGIFLNPGNKQLAPLFLYGQTVKPIEISVKGSFKGFVVLLYPHAVKALYGLNARELTDSCLDVALLEKNYRLGITDLLLNTSATDDRIELISAYIFQLMQKIRGDVHEMIRYSVNHILQSQGRVPLQQIYQPLKISERTFERRFEQHVGVTPRLFSRICTFQAAYCQLKRNQYQRLSDVAFDNGYSDQSHFIRTFREFTGYSPLQFQRNDDTLITNPVSAAD